MALIGISVAKYFCTGAASEQPIVCPGSTVSFECANEDRQHIEWTVYCYTSSSMTSCEAVGIPHSLAAVPNETQTANMICNNFMASAYYRNNSATLNITAPSTSTTMHLGILSDTCHSICNLHVAGKLHMY